LFDTETGSASCGAVGVNDKDTGSSALGPRGQVALRQPVRKGAVPYRAVAVACGVRGERRGAGTVGLSATSARRAGRANPATRSSYSLPLPLTAGPKEGGPGRERAETVDGEGKHSSAHGGSERVSVDRPRSRRVSSSVVYDRGADGASSPLPMAVVADDSGDLALDELTTAEVKLREHVESFRRTALRDARRIIHFIMPTKLEHLNGIVKARRRGTGLGDKTGLNAEANSS